MYVLWPRWIATAVASLGMVTGAAPGATLCSTMMISTRIGSELLEDLGEVNMADGDSLVVLVPGQSMPIHPITMC